jgi:anhydro-N-acetylmuramic acid kinase
MPRTIGLMSGTSLDGVDAAWLDTDGVTVAAFGPALTIPYDPALRRELRHILEIAPSLAADDPRLRGVTEQLTDYHVRAVQSLDCPADLIGFHGQTILHQPQHRRTWQIGDANSLSQRLGIPVVHDFRSADVAAGGQGAPLAPVYHAALASALPKPLAVLNIGGVANVTWIGRDGSLLAFDTGPGNGPLDDWAYRHLGTAYDRDGDLARSGTIDQAVLDRLMSDAYFHRSGPKSLDRLDFAATLANSGVYGLAPADGAATLARFTVASIAAATFAEPPSRWLVCGGGRLNPALMDGLRTALGVPVDPVETLGWNGDALEAQCFGFLAARSIAGLPLSYPTTTNVEQPMRGGRLAVPEQAIPAL